MRIVSIFIECLGECVYWWMGVKYFFCTKLHWYMLETIIHFTYLCREATKYSNIHRQECIVHSRLYGSIIIIFCYVDGFVKLVIPNEYL